MSTTKGAPSSSSLISLPVSPARARFCNCVSTEFLMFLTLFEVVLELLLSLSPPHQTPASAELMSEVLTGLMGLEVTGGDIMITVQSSLSTSSLLHCSDTTEQLIRVAPGESRLLSTHCMLHRHSQL